MCPPFSSNRFMGRENVYLLKKFAKSATFPEEDRVALPSLFGHWPSEPPGMPSVDNYFQDHCPKRGEMVPYASTYLWEHSGNGTHKEVENYYPTRRFLIGQLGRSGKKPFSGCQKPAQDVSYLLSALGKAKPTRVPFKGR